MWGSKSKKQRPDSYSKAVSAFTDGAESLQKFGYLGFTLTLLPVIILGALLAVAIVADSVFGTMEALFPWLMGAGVIISVFGMVLLAIERIASLKMSEMKMQMIVSTTDKLIENLIAKSPSTSTNDIEAIVGRVFEVVWGFDVQAKATT